MPGKHRLVNRAPHEHVVFNEAFDVGSRQVNLRVGRKLLPVSTAIQLAHVVGVTMPPIMAVKSVAVETGDGKQVS